MFLSPQKSLYQSENRKQLCEEKKNVDQKSFSLERTQDSLVWRINEKKIHEKISEIDQQNNSLFEISKRIKNTFFICGQNQNLPLIVSQISAQIKHSLKEIIERIDQSYLNIVYKMREILVFFKQNEQNEFSQRNRNKSRNQLFDSLDRSPINRMSCHNQYQKIQQIKLKIIKLQKQLNQTKGNQKIIISKIQNLSVNDNLRLERNIKRNCSQLKNIVNNPVSQIQKNLIPSKALQFKNALSNAKNKNQQKIRVIPQHQMKSLNNLIVSEAQSINSSQILLKESYQEAKQSFNNNKIDQNTLRKVFQSKQKAEYNKIFYQSDHLSLRKELKRNNSQSSFVLQHRMNKPKQNMQESCSFIKNINQKIIEVPFKILRKDSNNIQFSRNQTIADNRNHRQTFLIKNLIK